MFGLRPERSSAWLERQLWELDVAGSNPVVPTISFSLKAVDLLAKGKVCGSKFSNFCLLLSCAANEGGHFPRIQRFGEAKDLRQPSLGVLNELEEVANFWGERQFFLNLLGGGGSVQAAAEEDFMGLAERVLSFGGKAVPF